MDPMQQQNDAIVACLYDNILRILSIRLSSILVNEQSGFRLHSKSTLPINLIENRKRKPAKNNSPNRSLMSAIPQPTIVALATPPGKGGVGVIRVSGSLCRKISKALLNQSLTPRKAYYLPFREHNWLANRSGHSDIFRGPQFLHW